MFLKRKIIGELQRCLKTKEIVVLTGMRRVGKTTVYRALFDRIPSSNKAFLDLENPVDQRIFDEMDYNNIWANLEIHGVTPHEKAYLFLDEIQAYPGAVKAVKYLYDHYDVKFFLTGSSSYYLKNLFPESLAGRKVTLELHPLDFQEFLVFKRAERKITDSFREKDLKKNKITYEKNKKWFEEYLEYGGFPEVALASGVIQKKEKLNDIFKSYFEKDVRTLAEIRHLSAFRDLLFLLMGRVGSKLDITKLASEVGISRQTVYDYLTFLQATYVIDLISPFTKNVDREVSGAKKVYVCDNGFLTQFSRVNEGALLENAVFLNLRKYGVRHYYQKRMGGEIDFILPSKKTAIEVKQRGIDQDYKTLKKRARSLGMREAYVVTQNFVNQKGFLPASDL